MRKINIGAQGFEKLRTRNCFDGFGFKGKKVLIGEEKLLRGAGGVSEGGRISTQHI